MTALWSLLLWLYPPEYRRTFGQEILIVLAGTVDEVGGNSWMTCSRTMLKETFGLAVGAAHEWTARFSRSRYCEPPPVSEAAELEEQIRTTLRLMEHAIATHNFPKARFYSNEHRKLELLLGRQEWRRPSGT